MNEEAASYEKEVAFLCSVNIFRKYQYYGIMMEMTKKGGVQE